MKRLKTLTLALTLLMGISLTSCLNSGDDGPAVYPLIAHVESNIYTGSVYFVDAIGGKYIPTPASVAAWEAANSGYKLSDFKMAYILYTMVETEEGTATKADQQVTPGTYDINLQGVAKVEVVIARAVATKDQMESMAPETAPIMPLDFQDGYNQMAPAKYDDNTLLMMLRWYGASDNDKLKEHKFNAVYVTEDLSQGGNMDLYFRHDKGGDDKINQMWGSYYAIDITDVIRSYKNANGDAVPATIILKSKETTYASDKLPEQLTEHNIPYNKN